MKEAGLDPTVIYAVEETGRLVPEPNQHLFSKAELKEWNAAIALLAKSSKQTRKAYE